MTTYIVSDMSPQNLNLLEALEASFPGSLETDPVIRVKTGDRRIVPLIEAIADPTEQPVHWEPPLISEEAANRIMAAFEQKYSDVKKISQAAEHPDPQPPDTGKAKYTCSGCGKPVSGAGKKCRSCARKGKTYKGKTPVNKVGLLKPFKSLNQQRIDENIDRIVEADRKNPKSGPGCDPVLGGQLHHAGGPIPGTKL